jgi:hypothetical protein
MIDTSVAPPPAVLVHAAPLSVASDASIAAYLAAGDRVHMLAGIFGLVCVALVALLMVTWALGLLPGTVRLV